ncbi:indole-3-pyruvate decarboxylase [Mycobacterium xenopi 4042]|uniref:Indole-3-pyruvate decarboxylase n=1 Tax=Mycobacterium xenopi 4042 TaxID=1299334 RepID=X8AEG5_MYCXE|nr:indole-3-pyruvate decarboxylase [Mycobacterium xenopi 4042]
MATDVARFPAEPPAAPLPRYTGGTSPRALSLFIDAATKLIADHQVTVLADYLVHRLDAIPQLQALLSADVVPHATLMWGKSLVDESHPNFLGIYVGAASPEPVRRAVEEAPVLVTAGVVFTDMVSSFFSQRIDPARTIDVGVDQSTVAGQVFAPLEMGTALQALATIIAERGITSPPVTPASDSGPLQSPPRDQPLTQKMLWDRLAAALTPGMWWSPTRAPRFTGWRATGFRGGDVHRPAPLGVDWLHPASGARCRPGPPGPPTGAADRRRSRAADRPRPGVFSREGLTPVIVLVNNDGYTIERAIHGKNACYNDIVSWNWLQVPRALGVTNALTFRAQTYGELDDAFTAAAQHQDRMVFIEVVVPRFDVPDLLAELARPTSADGSTRR